MIVVGGSRGIGLALARRCASAGASVEVVGRDQGRLQGAAAEIGAGVRTASLDVRSEDAVAAWAARMHPIDYVVVAVGDLYLAEVASSDLTSARKAFDSKFWATVHVAKHIGPVVRAGGSLLFLAGGGSSPNWRPPQAWAFTAAANCAIVALAQALALELAPTRVNVVSPGLIIAPDDPLQEDAAFMLPVGHAGSADSVADLCLTILQNPFLTGVSVPVDGGAHLV